MEEHYSEQFHAATLSDPVAQNEATAGGAPAQPKRPAAPPVNFGNIPDGLKDDNRWTVWFYGDRHGAPTKIPVMADAAKKAWNNDPERRAAWNKEKKEEAEREGREWKEKDRGGASSTDTETWSSFDDAKRTYKRSQYNQKYRYDGVGIMLDGKLDENGLTLGAIDLDKVIGNPEREARAAQIIEAMDSYTEVSPSGKGYRIFFKTDVVLPTGGLIHDGVEIYSNIGRFLTITGQVVDGRNELKDASGAFREVIAKHIPLDVVNKDTATEARSTALSGNDAGWDLGECPDHLKEAFGVVDNNDLNEKPDIKALREAGPVLAQLYGERSKWLELVESIAGTIAKWPGMEDELVSVFHEISALAPGYEGKNYPHDANEKKLREFISKARRRNMAGGAVRTLGSVIREGRQLQEVTGVIGGPVDDGDGVEADSAETDAEGAEGGAEGPIDAQVSSGGAGNGSSGTGNGSSGSGSGGAVWPRQPFKYTVGALSLTAKAAAGVLAQRNAKIYQYAGRIVCPTTNDAIDPMGRKTRKVSLRQAEVVTMERVLSEHMEWVGTKLKTDPATGKMKPADVHIDPPKKIASTILDMGAEAGFPPLMGVFNCPTLRHDGSIVSKRGYDERTGLYIDTDVVLPPIPNQPTKDDALAALDTLNRSSDGGMAKYPTFQGDMPYGAP